ncbi:MFS transporter [Rhizobium tropici]|uniref:histidine kinase n=1 Tax=Rhizobium tropici TaxID=398 RepID=A0A329Y360_RHITR|nr:MFS transporter [Rhizobium tropici]RAX37883.1 histidine kinase [Rhizobium tropici]
MADVLPTETSTFRSTGGGTTKPIAVTSRILVSSLIGTSVEFYDFYIYATAASLIFGPLFFPASVSSLELIGAYASFGIAFMARPIGGVVFGHFGDRVGRKATLVASLLLMGLSTAAIGLLPSYAVAGWLAPALLCLLRFGQGLALGGEWTGAVLLALENAPPGWRARFAMFAPLGAPIGFLLANGLFLLLTVSLTPAEFASWGWRIPFLVSLPLVGFGLWLRFNLVETPEFTEAVAETKPARVPLVEVVRDHSSQLIIGAFGVVACFSLYYVVTAFALGYGTTSLGYTRAEFLGVQLIAILFMAGSIIIASWLADRLSHERVLIWGCVGTILSGIAISPMMSSGSLSTIFLYLALSLCAMGFVNGPLGAWLPSLFPARVRYSGTSLAFNIGGIVGGAFSPVIAQTLASTSGLLAVGFYLAITGGLSLVAFDASARARTMHALTQSEKRYRAIFEQNHVSLCELDLSRLREKLDEIALADGGSVRDFFERHPGSADECADLIHFVDVNDATVKLFACSSAEELLGPMRRFLPTNADTFLSLIFAVEDSAERYEKELHLLTRQGKPVTVLFIAALTTDRDALDRVACAMIDVTEREQAKEALLAAQVQLARAGRVATVGAVSATIAHEVNQPIGAAVMFAQACIRWLKSETPDIRAAHNAAEKVVQHSMRASQIIQRTREQIKGNQPRPELVDLKELVLEVIGLLEREVVSSATRIKSIFAELDHVVLANRVEMQQVVANLVTNAIHAMTETSLERREVKLVTDQVSDETIRLTVRDNGTGIRPENLAKLFDPFFTTKSEGMGVGLSICKTIVDAHGGSLTARNHPDGGAIFEMILPQAATPSHGAASIPAV